MWRYFLIACLGFVSAQTQSRKYFISFDCIQLTVMATICGELCNAAGASAN